MSDHKEDGLQTAPACSYRDPDTRRTAIYVDLDKKTLSLVINDGSDLSDKQIEKLAEQAGYRIAAIRRDSEAMGG